MITNLDQESQHEEEYLNWLKFNEVKDMNWLNLKVITLSDYRLSSSSDLKGRRLIHLDDIFCKVIEHHPYKDKSNEGKQKYQNFVDLMVEHCWFMRTSYHNAKKISSYWNLSTLLPVQIWKVAGMPNRMNYLMRMMKMNDGDNDNDNQHDNKKEMNVDDNDKDVEEVKNNDDDDDKDFDLGLPNELITYNQHENAWQICDDKETKIIKIQQICEKKVFSRWEYGRIIRRLKKIIDLERVLLERKDDYGEAQMNNMLFNQIIDSLGTEGHQNACMSNIFDGYINPEEWILYLWPKLRDKFFMKRNNEQQRPQIGSKGMELDQENE